LRDYSLNPFLYSNGRQVDGSSNLTVLEARGIKKHFGGVIALDGANLTCKRGKITGLLGANGSGKSTMSKIITGVYSADAGEIKYNGRPVRYRSPNEAKQDGIAMVFQNLSLVADLTVWQNIVLGAEQSRGLFLDNRAAIELSREIVDQLLPGFDVRRMVHQLNPGEMQIVEIAKAISENPKLLILDEPTAALEQAQVKSLFDTMRALVKKGVAIVFTSHRLWEVMEICDEAVIFRNGCNVADLDFSTEVKDPEKIVSYITGETGAAKVEKTRKAESEQVVLRVDKLNYGSCIRNVSFDLKRGEILGIGGLAGQGQHELMLALAGNYSSVSGEVELNGKKIKLNKPANAIRNSILLVPGDRQLEGLFLGHSVFTNLIFPKLGLKAQPLFTPEKRYRRESEKIVDTLSIVTYNLDMPVNSLSGGNQQKVVVGKWLSFDTNVLLLADPAKGVDVGAKRDLYEYIVGQVAENRMSVVLYASDNEELIEYCDRLLIMYEGEIVSTLEGDEITDDAIVATSMRVR
jgi:ribose transport system ATP-binding protein